MIVIFNINATALMLKIVSRSLMKRKGFRYFAKVFCSKPLLSPEASGRTGESLTLMTLSYRDKEKGFTKYKSLI
jgi:hypothetical protein